MYEQGLVVDSIESSVEQTSVYVSQGTENLRLAGSYKVNLLIIIFFSLVQRL